MEIFPSLQLAMLLAAFCGGALFGLLFDVGIGLRILLLAYDPPPSMKKRYEKKLPLLGRAIGFPKPRAARRLWRGTVICVGDFFFCLLFALMVELVLYAFGRGRFRISVLLCALAGLAAWRLSAARLSALVSAFVALWLSAAGLYLRAALRLPVCLLCRFVGRFIQAPLAKCRQKRKIKKMRRISHGLCAVQLKLAANGFSGACKPRYRDVKREERLCQRKTGKRHLRLPSSSVF